MEKITTTDCIILFMRAPEINRVKTRLSQKLGSKKTLEIYKCFVSDILKIAQNTKIEVKIFFYPPGSHAQITDWLGNQHDLYPQKGKNLGLRMANAFSRVFASAYNRVILIGTDCPDMTSHILMDAFKGITDKGSVIGPSKDGGYYLIGFSEAFFHEDLFHDITWGTEKVYQNTLDLFSQKKIDPHILKVLNDIDTLDDLKSFFDNSKNNNQCDTQTFQYILTNGF